jgi:hypothetical protein
MYRIFCRQRAGQMIENMINPKVQPAVSDIKITPEFCTGRIYITGVLNEASYFSGLIAAFRNRRCRRDVNYHCQRAQ